MYPLILSALTQTLNPLLTGLPSPRWLPIAALFQPFRPGLLLQQLLHALESEAVQIELGDDIRLTLSRKPKKRQMSSFVEGARCFRVYSQYLLSHHPQRSTDLMAYLYIIASCHAEYNFPACMAYDVAFRRKAARFHLASRGKIDPQLYTKAFTGSSKACPRAWCDHCLTSSHTSYECILFSPAGPAKKSRVTTADTKHTSQGDLPELQPGEVLTRQLPSQSHVCLNPKYAAWSKCGLLTIL